MSRPSAQVLLIILLLIFLGVFLLPDFSIPVNYKAYSWEEVTLDIEDGEVRDEVELLTVDPQDVDPELVERSEEVTDGAISWSGLDFDLIGVDSALANFQKGNDIYPAREFVFTSALTERKDLVERDAQIIRHRITAAGLTDVKIEKIRAADESPIISLTFPASYTKDQAGILANMLMSNGRIIFRENDVNAEEVETQGQEQTLSTALYERFLPGFTPTSSQVQVPAIESITVESRTEYRVPVWRLKFKEGAREAVNATLRRSGIDPEDSVAVNPDLRNTPLYSLEFNSAPQMVMVFIGDLEFLAIPLGIISTYDELRVAASYILSESVVGGYSQLDETIKKPQYATSGRTVLALSVMAAVLVGAVLSFRGKGANYLVGGILVTLTPLIISVSILKLIAQPISLGLVMAVLLGTVMSLAMGNYSLSQANKEELDKVLPRIREYSAFIFIFCGLLYLSGGAFGIYQEFLGIVAIIATALYISYWIIPVHIFEWINK